MLESLAVVRADGACSLAELLAAEGRRLGRHDFMTVITPSLDERWVAALAEIAQRGVRVSAVLIEPDTFGAAPSSLLTVSALAAAGITSAPRQVRRADRAGVCRPGAHRSGEASVASLAACPCPPRLRRAVVTGASGAGHDTRRRLGERHPARHRPALHGLDRRPHRRRAGRRQHGRAGASAVC